MKRTIKFIRRPDEDSQEFLTRITKELITLRNTHKCTLHACSIIIEHITKDPLTFIKETQQILKSIPNPTGGMK